VTSSGLNATVAAIWGGKPVLLPTDTVYGLCANAYSEVPVRRALALKGRADAGRPAALLAASVDVLVESIPELRGRAATIARALLPGPYTLVLANPARRFPWLTADRPETIGVRVARLPEGALDVLDTVGAVMATSANASGGRDPARLDDVPADIRAACAAEIDAGPLPGTPSTVLEFTGEEPRVWREGAGPVAEALERVRAALG
jgi:L-threonylcarbamoyladenylate synthase